MDFEAKAREVLLELLGTFSDATDRDSLCFIADALRAAALDEGAREAARAELARLLAEVKESAHRPPLTDVEGEAAPAADFENIDQAISAAIRNPATSLTTASMPIASTLRDYALAPLLERLLWLLGLSGGERRFVTALADDWAGDFDGLSVFADWLEDQGRPEDGIRVRRLVPRDGDVIVVRHPPGPRHEAHCATVQQIVDALAARGVRVWAVTMSDDMSLETAPPDAMRAAGWVRAEDAREVAGRAVVQAVAATLDAAGVHPTPDLYERVAARVRASLVPWPTPVEVPPA